MRCPDFDKKWSYTVVPILLLSLLVSCAKTESNEEPVPDPTPNPQDSVIIKPVDSVRVVGFVELYNLDQRIFPIGMRITLYNSKDTVRHTISENTEIFQLEKVPVGVYTVRYERDSIGTTYLFGANINLVGQTNFIKQVMLGYKSLGTLAYFKIDTLASNSGNWYFRQVRDPKPTKLTESTIRYFASASRDVSYNRFDTSWTMTYGSFSMDTLETSLDYRFFEKLGFSTGSKIYVKAHTDGFYSNEYYDPLLKRVVYPNVDMSSSSIDSFIFRR